MTFDNPILFFICSLGVFNGFLVSFYFLFFNRQKRVQNFLFGLMTLFLSMRIGKSLYIVFTPREDREILWIQIGLSACLMIGVALFFYVKSSIEQQKSFPRSWRIHLGLLLSLVVIVGVIRPYEQYPAFWSEFFVWFIYTVWGIYLIATGIILRNTFQKYLSKDDTCTTLEYWLMIVWLANLLIFAAYIIGYFYLYLVGTITFSVVFYGLLIFFLSEKNRDAIFNKEPEKYTAKRIDDQEAKRLIDELIQLMEEQHLYKNTDIKLQKVAQQIHISGHKLSQLLNDNLGKNFNAFVNGYRIEEAKRLLLKNDKLTLEAIGYEAGFSSKSNFYNIFKKTVGMTPSQFQNQRPKL